MAPAARARPAFDGPAPAQVVRVIDGDTVEVTVALWIDLELTTRVRLVGVDAPEIFRPDCAAEREAGLAAKAFAEAFLADGRAILTEVRRDKYGGRVAARLADAKGRDLGAALVAAGLAEASGPRGASGAGFCGPAAAALAERRSAPLEP